MKKINVFIFVIMALLAAALISCDPNPGSGGKEPDSVETSIVITGDPYVGSRLGVTITGYAGYDPVWFIGDVRGVQGSSAYTIKEEDIGKMIKVKLLGYDINEQEFFLEKESNAVGPVCRGWSVETIAKYTDNDSARVFQEARGLAIDSTGKLYIGANVAYVGWCVAQIDPAVIEESGYAKATVFAKEGSGGINGAAVRSVAVGPNDEVYASLVWGKDRGDGSYILCYEQPGGNIPNWLSGNIFKVLSDAGVSYADPINGNILGDIVVDAGGNMYLTVHQWNNYIYIAKVTPQKAVSVFAGGLKRGEEEDIIGRFSWPPSSTAIDPSGNIYIGDGYHKGMIKKISNSSGTVTKFAGNDWGDPFVVMGYLSYGRDGNIYVLDRISDDSEWGPIVCKVNSQGEVTYQIAGNSSVKAYVDGYAANGNAKFNEPTGIAAGADGTIYVLDWTGEYDKTSKLYAVRKIWLNTSTTP